MSYEEGEPMTSSTRLLPKYYFQKMDSEQDQMTSRFCYVAGYQAEGKGANAKLTEIWKEGTLSQIQADADIMLERALSIPEGKQGHVPFSDILAMDDMIDNMLDRLEMGRRIDVMTLDV